VDKADRIARDEYRYRVFISYSHQDAGLVERISSILDENGLQPMLDKGFASGYGFTDQIKNYIAHAHIFMPVITRESSSRGWVHQEIGYAMALKIPVLPISNGQMPGQMIQELQAVRWEEGKYWRRKNKPKLDQKVFDSLARRAQLDSQALFECAQFQEERTALMVSYAKGVLELDACGHVRQKGALSSFHIPDKPITHPDWDARYGSRKPGDYRCRLQRDERLALEEHARRSGCSLIIDPSLTYKKYGPAARKARLGELLAFLESMPDHMVRIAINAKMPAPGSITMVGNWFYAESISASIGQGYQQTIFTRHAPSIQAKLELFDRELNELLKAQKGGEANSRKYALDVLKITMGSV
jgi:hypothetical protein